MDIWGFDLWKLGEEWVLEWEDIEFSFGFKYFEVFGEKRRYLLGSWIDVILVFERVGDLDIISI